MRLLQAWRESRGRKLENELIDLVARIQGMSPLAKSICFNDIRANQRLAAAYGALSVAQRKLFMRALKKGAHQLWKQGRHPSVIGLGIVLLNIESRHVPGESAATVFNRTNAIIERAAQYAPGRRNRLTEKHEVTRDVWIYTADVT
jgi:hypothetical protein